MNAFDSPDRIAPAPSAPLATAPAGQAPVVQDVLTIPRKLPASDKVNIVGLTREQLRDALIAAGTPEKQARMRVQQLWHWLYVRGVSDFADMLNISRDLRETLNRHFTIARPEIVEEQISNDGTRKWLLRSPDGHDYEAVFIPDADRGTLCVSSQVGCTLNCRFCHTGTMRLVRNLTAGEIVGQVMLARDALGEWPSQPEGRMLTNIVMMGMGEPLYNFDAVRDALRVVMDGDGLALTIDDGTSSEVVAAFCAFAVDAGVRLTFFPNGRYRSWEDNAAALRSLTESGQIAWGNHTWSHPDLTTLDDAEVAEEVRRNRDWLRTAFGVSTPFLRPPFGARDERTDRIAADLGHPTIAMWNGTLGDARVLPPAELVGHAREWFTAQTIVVGHANHRTVTTVYGELLDVIRERGLRTVTLADAWAVPASFRGVAATGRVRG